MKENGTRRNKVRVPPLQSPWFKVERWKLTFKGRWKSFEHISVQEARTAVSLIRHLGRSAATRGRKFLAFTDNMAVLGVLGKGRSSCPPLLRQARKAAAVTLAFGVRVLWRYIPSEYNPSDGPSRGQAVGAAPATVAEHAQRMAADRELFV